MHHKNCNHKKHPFGKYCGMPRKALQRRTNRKYHHDYQRCINEWHSYAC